MCQFLDIRYNWSNYQKKKKNGLGSIFTSALKLKADLVISSNMHKHKKRNKKSTRSTNIQVKNIALRAKCKGLQIME